MIEASCHCGAVTIEISRAPDTVTDCNCSICRRYGALWAYYPLADVRVSGPSKFYIWGDREIEFHHCETCACITHWAPVDASRNRMGVNARLMEAKILAEARVRRLDGAVTEQYLDD